MNGGVNQVANGADPEPEEPNQGWINHFSLGGISDEQLVHEVLARGLLTEIFSRCSRSAAVNAACSSYSKLRAIVRNAPDSMLKTAFEDYFFALRRDDRDGCARWMRRLIRARNANVENQE